MVSTSITLLPLCDFHLLLVLVIPLGQLAAKTLVDVERQAWISRENVRASVELSVCLNDNQLTSCNYIFL